MSPPAALRPHDEFPAGAAEWPNEFSRRRFLKLMAASAALAGTVGCTRQPPERIVPYVRQPEELVPGKPLFFATALTLGGFARGVLVETHEGRPTKIEGNPDHPATLGASDALMQAELLALYDPERSAAVLKNGQESTWEILLGELPNMMRARAGAGLRLLTGHETSPTLIDQMKRLLAKYPGAKWHEHEPLGASASDARYHFDRAEVILSLGGDFLSSGPANLRYTREFSAGRRNQMHMNRLYVAESTPSLTGAMADHRIVLTPDELNDFAREISGENCGGASSSARSFAGTISADLRAHPGKSLVIAGDFESIALHHVARTLNQSLQNIGATVEYSGIEPNGARDLAELVADIQHGLVDTLLIIGANPVYDAPADFEFARLLSTVPHAIHMGLYRDETAELCHWHIPEAHALEGWSDARAFDGTTTIVQPVIEPLFGGRSRHDLLSALLEEAPSDSYEMVRSFWQKQNAASDFERVWRKTLHDGITLGMATPAPPSPAPSPAVEAPAPSETLHLLFRPSMQTYDGRFANNAWLQEFPDPLTKIVWDNAALISPATAARFHLTNDDVVKLTFRDRSIAAPVSVLPGQADNCVTVAVGYGRTRCGSVGSGIGFNAYALRPSDALWGGPDLTITNTGKRHRLVTTQTHWNMEGRNQVRAGTFAQFQKEPRSVATTSEPPPPPDDTLYPPVAYEGHAWGMAIDLNTCIGCGACTIACQAENNIPVVGKEQVAAGREMHWIRVDIYREGHESNPQISHQPVPCMHCENAPCELVCPVAATVHDSEGLNQMVYNRCVGTRYCSNNCPYKVRRFNFLEYGGNEFEKPVSRRLMRNPDVTVRSRGVMEKCTYCIQRINAVKIEAGKANRTIRDGEIIPACAQACPAEAIVFGDINDAQSRVARLKASPLNYALLAELNTRPRTTYLARLRNPNPEMEKK
jgi:molybdopterin-containing oxidoreductase family iron-sulfur binding subunit